MARDDLPLKPPPEAPKPKPPPTPAPAWVALLAAWLGLIVLVASIVFVFLPLHSREQFAAAGRFLPVPMYGIVVTLFVGIIVLWQMRKVPRPLEPALANQRIQAYTGIALSLLATLILYVYVIFFVM